MTTLAAQTLFRHIRNKDAISVQSMLQTSLLNLDERDRDGQTFLMVACQIGCMEIVTILFEHTEVDINAVDNDSWSALMNAAKEGHVDIVIALTERGAFLEHRDIGAWTALMWACYKNRFEVVRELLDRGANPNVRGEHNMSCLTWASGRGYAETVRLLLNCGAEPNTADKYGTTPLMWAARRGHNQIVEYLLKEGATIDNAGMHSWTALIMAAKGGFVEVVSSLLEYYPNVNAVDKDSYTALTHAAKEGYVLIVQLLLEKGAYVNRPDRYGDTILIHAAKGGHVEVVKALLRRHADVDVQGVDEKTALYWAVEKGHPGVVKLLLDANANTETPTKDGDTPLLKAVRSRNMEAVQMLLEKGAKASASDTRGDNALHIAVRGRSKRVTELLLRNPKDGRLLYRPNKAGETPYQIDADYEKRILTQVFGARNLNADDNIEGYELYSSTIADVLSEPSLNIPITVGLYAKWGSGKSFLIKKLVEEMKNFTRHNVEALFEFSWLQFVLTFFPSVLIGGIIALAFRWEAGLGIGLGLILLQYIFLGVMWVGSIKKDWSWAYFLSVAITRKLSVLKLLLQVMFCNEPTVSNKDTAAVKFLFTDNARLASVVGEKSITMMIGTLCDSLEKEFGTMSTRLYKVLKPAMASSNGRFKSLCCVPYFVIVIFVTCCIITECSLFYVYGFQDLFDSNISTVDGVVMAILVVIGLSLLGNIYTWSCMLISLVISPRRRVQKIMSSSESMKMEGLIQHLKKEVEMLGEMTRCMDAFQNMHTRLVVIVDGLDSCEQEKLLQVLDTVHMLFSDDRSPFVTILAVDPHVIIKGIEHNLQGLFRDSSINGHDYLRNIVQLPFFLQSQTMPRTRYSIPNKVIESQLNKEVDKDASANHATVIYNRQDSTVSSFSINEKCSNKKRSPQHASLLASTNSNFGSTQLLKNSSQQDLTKSMGKSSYFSDINPRSMKRMMNIIAVTGRLLRACNVDFNWYKLAAWVNITEQWPYRLSWIILEIEHSEKIQENMPLKNVYEIIVPKLPHSKEVDPRLEIDRNERKLEVFLQNGRPLLLVGDLKRFMPCTINVDPYFRKLIKEQIQNAENAAYEFSMYAGSVTALDQYGWPYQIKRSRSELSPRATPNPLMRASIMSAGSPLPYPGPAPMVSPYGLYSPPSHMHLAPQGIHSNLSTPMLNKNRVSIQGGLPQETLMSMSVDEVSDLLCRLDGIDQSKLDHYVHCLHDNNISGPVLLTCDLAELKPEMKMTFGDWELFRTLVQVLRERELSFESGRPDQNNVDGCQSPNIKFTQDKPPIETGVQAPLPHYPYNMNLQARKNASDPFMKKRDMNFQDQYRRKSSVYSRQNISQMGFNQENAPQESKSISRKDSFFGEVMLESAAIRGVVEAVGVNTDTGDETDEDIQRNISPIEEERLSIISRQSSHRSHRSLMSEKKPEVDPRYKIGDSESADSDSDEVVLLARRTSSKMSLSKKNSVPKFKLNSMNTMSNESLSGVTKQISSGKMSRTGSKESMKKIGQDISVSMESVSSKKSFRNRKKSKTNLEDEAMICRRESLPLIEKKSSEPVSVVNKAMEKEVAASMPSSSLGADLNTEIVGAFSSSLATPSPSCEHLALRTLSQAENINAPSAFKAVTPTSSRASSRASSLGQSLGTKLQMEAEVTRINIADAVFVYSSGHTTGKTFPDAPETVKNLETNPKV